MSISLLNICVFIQFLHLFNIPNSFLANEFIETAIFLRKGNVYPEQH